MDLISILLSILALGIILFVLNRYFSGTNYTGKLYSLQGKTAILTGGNTGIGKQTAIILAKQGCRVIIGARDTQKSQKLVQNINSTQGNKLCQHYYLDLGDLQSVKKFAQKIQADKIQFLINNAGVMALPKRTLCKSGFEMQYGINHIGHFYLTYLLWQKLNKAQFFRIINVSSLAHKKLWGIYGTPRLNFQDMNFQKTKYFPTLAYSRSKLYNNLFTHALAEKISIGKGLAVSLHPGVVRTQLTRYMISGWQQKAFQIVNPIYAIFTKSPLQGAQTTISLIFQNAEKIKNGGYYSDCHLSSENSEVNKKNWDKLWQISERDLNIKFQAA